jgi:hypothetical protein
VSDRRLRALIRDRSTTAVSFAGPVSRTVAPAEFLSVTLLNVMVALRGARMRGGDGTIVMVPASPPDLRFDRAGSEHPPYIGYEFEAPLGLTGRHEP